MSKSHVDPLFQLIKLLTKSEKRNFKLFVNRQSASHEWKVTQLFDAIDGLSKYDEQAILKKVPALTKAQLSNTKAHLNKLILDSLALIKNESNVRLQLHEMMARVHILHDKGLYRQCLKMLRQVEEQAKHYHQLTYLQQCYVFENRIALNYVVMSVVEHEQSMAYRDAVNRSVANMIALSNLSVDLYYFYVHEGHVRHSGEIDAIERRFSGRLLLIQPESMSFYESMYYFQCHCWLAFIKLDFLNYFKHALRWHQLYARHPQMMELETDSYIKSLHNLMTAYFYLLRPGPLAHCIHKLKKLLKQQGSRLNTHNFISAYKYLFTAQIDLCFLQGRFQTGLKLVPVLEKSLATYGQYIDEYRVLLFYYKIACLYFGSGDSAQAVLYLNKIIHSRQGLRSDIQCYARLLHLIAHYEMGHSDLVEYLIKSVYRYLLKMSHINQVEEAVLTFLRTTLRAQKIDMHRHFNQLLSDLRKLERNPFTVRAFIYLDIISWLESKIQGVRVESIIREKYLLARRT